MEKIIAGYIRVSTEMQVDRDSVVNQEDSVKAFAKSKERRFQIFKDLGISAKNQDRPGYQAMLAAIREGIVDTVVVTKLDRITRSLKDLLFLKDFFEEHDVAFVALTQSLDTATPMGRFSFYVLGLVAQLEREVTAERVAEVMRSRALKKKWNGGVVPFGFTSQRRLFREWLNTYALKHHANEVTNKESLKKLSKTLETDIEVRNLAQSYAESKLPDPHALVIDEKEADVVRHIFKLYLEGKSFRSVTHRLNDAGYRTRQGVTWASTSIRRILQNPVYIGTLTYNKRKSKGNTSKPRPKEEHLYVPDVFESIIERVLFEEVQALIAQQKNVAPRAKDSTYLLTSIIKCGHCGSRMYGYTYDDSKRRPGRIYQYYRCNGNTQKGASICSGNSINLRFLDSLMVQELKNFKLHPEKLISKVEDHNKTFDKQVAPLQERLNQCRKTIAGLENKVARLFTLYEEELINKTEFAERKKELTKQRHVMEEEIEQLETKVDSQDVSNIDIELTLNQFSSLAEVYDSLEIQDQRELVRTVLDEVIVGDKWIDYSIYAFNQDFVTTDCTGRGSSPLPA